MVFVLVFVGGSLAPACGWHCGCNVLVGVCCSSLRSRGELRQTTHENDSSRSATPKAWREAARERATRAVRQSPSSPDARQRQPSAPAIQQFVPHGLILT